MEKVDYNIMRRAMIDSQLRTSGVTSSWVIAAMGEVAREDYVPAAMRTTAYMDRSVLLADGTTLNPPLATAMLLQTSGITPNDHVLLVAPQNGYTAALLSRRTKNFVATETPADLNGNGSFSSIIIDGAVQELPDYLMALAQDGARVVTGTVEGNVTRLASGIIRGGKVALRPFMDTEISVLPAFTRKKEFVF